MTRKCAMVHVVLVRAGAGCASDVRMIPQVDDFVCWKALRRRVGKAKVDIRIYHYVRAQ